MPTHAKRVCNQPGCGALTDDRYCDKHQRNNSRTQFDKQRNTTNPLRAYYKTAAWSRTRAFVLSRDPVCKDCGRLASVVADHIVNAHAFVAGGGDFYDLSNLQGLCKSCHDSKTAKECGWAGAKT
jgi:5-methylcytosine-specific restriction protein A